MGRRAIGDDGLTERPVRFGPGPVDLPWTRIETATLDRGGIGEPQVDKTARVSVSWITLGSLLLLWCMCPYPAVAAGGAEHRLYTPVKRRVWVVRRQHSGTSVVTSARLKQIQPSHREPIAVRVVNSTIYLDPQADYIRQGEHRIDANHYIPTAQRLYRSLNARPARIIRREDYRRPVRHRRIERSTRRQAIFVKPFNKPRDAKPKKTPIPTVPRPPQKSSRLLAMSANAPIAGDRFAAITEAGSGF